MAYSYRSTRSPLLSPQNSGGKVSTLLLQGLVNRGMGVGADIRRF